MAAVGAVEVTGGWLSATMGATEQLCVGIADAFIRLRAHAYAHDRGLAHVARDIVARRLRLRPDPGPPKSAQA